MRILDMTYVQDIHEKKHWVKIWEEIYESFIQMLLLLKKKGRKTSELFKWVQIAHRYKSVQRNTFEGNKMHKILFVITYINLVSL